MPEVQVRSKAPFALFFFSGLHARVLYLFTPTENPYTNTYKPHSKVEPRQTYLY